MLHGQAAEIGLKSSINSWVGHCQRLAEAGHQVPVESIAKHCKANEIIRLCEAHEGNLGKGVGAQLIVRLVQQWYMESVYGVCMLPTEAREGLREGELELRNTSLAGNELQDLMQGLAEYKKELLKLALLKNAEVKYAEGCKRLEEEEEEGIDVEISAASSVNGP